LQLGVALILSYLSAIMDETPAASPLPKSDEVTLWKGNTSQWVHFWFYLFCILIAVGCLAGTPFTAGLSAIGLVVPIAMWIGRWLVTKSTSYHLTSERLMVTTGFFNRREDNLELYRVKDYTLDQPFLLRLLTLGNITLITTDTQSPIVNIRAISAAVDVREKLRHAVESARDRKRVRQLDVADNLADSPPDIDGDHLHS